MTRKAVAWTAGGLGLAALLLVLALSSGWRLFAVLTPSMGQTAPVGTLVVTHAESSYATGEIISFHRGDRVYTHRIVDTRNGQFVTKGDLNGAADPTTVPTSQVIGKAIWLAPGIGWLLMGLPWIAVGTLGFYLVSLFHRRSEHGRWAIRLAGTTLVLCLVALWLRPWVNLELLGYTPADTGGGVMMHVVNTGLFPVKATDAVLASGQDAVVHVTEQGVNGAYVLTPTPALTLLQRLILLTFCLLPLLAAFQVRRDPDGEREFDDAPPAGRPLVRRAMPVLAVTLCSVLAVTAVSLGGAWAAYGASIKNSTDTAGSKSFFACRNAVSSLGSSNVYLAWALGSSGASTETDLSGNSRTGAYLATTATTGSVGCKNDSPAASVTFNGTSQCLYLNNNYATSGYYPNTFSLEAWFKTSTTSNGKIIGFGSSRNSAADGNYDRHIYIDKVGRVVFGVYPSAVKVVATAAGTSYADGNWHHVVATLSSAGQYLYVDGSLAASNTAVTSGEALHGYWKVGCGKLTTWSNGDGTNYDGPSYFTGQIQYAAVYSLALSADQVKDHYLAGPSS